MQGSYNYILETNHISRAYSFAPIARLQFMASVIFTLTSTRWLYGRQRALAFLTTNVHSSLSTDLCCHLLIFISRRSVSTSSSHLNRGLPLLLLPSVLLPNIFLTLLPWYILTTCPTLSNLFFLMSVIMSRYNVRLLRLLLLLLLLLLIIIISSSSSSSTDLNKRVTLTSINEMYETVTGAKCWRTRQMHAK